MPYLRRFMWNETGLVSLHGENRFKSWACAFLMKPSFFCDALSGGFVGTKRHQETQNLGNPTAISPKLTPSSFSLLRFSGLIFLFLTLSKFILVEYPSNGVYQVWSGWFKSQRKGPCICPLSCDESDSIGESLLFFGRIFRYRLDKFFLSRGYRCASSMGRLRCAGVALVILWKWVSRCSRKCVLCGNCRFCKIFHTVWIIRVNLKKGKKFSVRWT